MGWNSPLGMVKVWLVRRKVVEAAPHTIKIDRIIAYYMILLLLPFSVLAGYSLAYVQVLARHGARFRTQDEYAPGQLTSVGIRQHYLLGRLLRKRYGQDIRFISQPFESPEVRLFSSGVNRTLVSAQSLLHGLYKESGPAVPDSLASLAVPPQQGQKVQIDGSDAIPGKVYPSWVESSIEYASATMPGDILRDYSEQNCPQVKQFKQDNQKLPEYSSYMQNQKVKLFVSRLKECGIKQPTNGSQLYNAVQKMYVDKFLVREYCPLLDQESVTANFILMAGLQLQTTMTQQQITTVSSGYLQQTLNNSQSNLTKLMIYQGHESTIVYVLAALNLSSFACTYSSLSGQTPSCVAQYPGFASTLIFQLWNDGSNNISNYMVKVLYNGKRLQLPFCEQDCSYSQFKMRLEEVIDPGYLSLCGLGPQHGQWIVIMVEGLAVVLAGLFLLFVLFYKPAQIGFKAT